MNTLRPILIVEDNPLDLKLTLFALEKCRLSNEVIAVRDGHEAIEFLERKGKYAEREAVDPVVVLLDLKLPKLTGHDVLDLLRGSENLCNIPVVILSSSKEHRDVLRSYDKGANAYVVKPIDLKEFTTAIAELGIF